MVLLAQVMALYRARLSNVNCLFGALFPFVRQVASLVCNLLFRYVYVLFAASHSSRASLPDIQPFFATMGMAVCLVKSTNDC
jgi:hypothetical protein